MFIEKTEVQKYNDTQFCQCMKYQYNRLVSSPSHYHADYFTS